MSRVKQFAALACGSAALTLWSCGQQVAVDAALTITASPSTIAADGAKTTLTLEATDSANLPGTGTVSLVATAGQLSNTAPILQAGTATVTFACDVSADPGCTGRVKVTATWTPATPSTAEPVIANLMITLAPTDAGAGTRDGGTGDGGAGDGGAGDGGTTGPGTQLDGGTFDGGFYGATVLSLGSDKAVLLAGTLDRATISAHLATNSTSPAPVAGSSLSFSVTGGGSFDSASAKGTTTGVTDASGLATAVLYVGTATKASSPLVVKVNNGQDAQATLLEPVVQTSSLSFVTADSLQLNIKSTQIGTSTSLQYVVKDVGGQPVQGVDMAFQLAPNSAAGSLVSPATARTNAVGVAVTTLFSGDAQGTATITATVLGLSPVDSPAFTIVIGRPSDGRLAVDCARKVLGARQSTGGSSTVRDDQSTTCTASGIADRNGVKTSFPVAVTWLTEVGSITSSQAAAASGKTTTTFTTAGFLPVPTTPFPGEPFNGDNNPRDSFVTIVAVLDGEEQFWDGSGSSNGVQNGKWDPGEWFVDLPEPFVDSNDNGTWDPGEPFVDTEHVDCVTGQVIPKNGQWDGPNGCWDAQTKIWRPTHVVYSDAVVNLPAVGQFIQFSAAGLPSVVSVGGVSVVDFAWWDRFFNRLSSDNASVTLATIYGTRGTVILTPSVGGEAYGHDLQYLTRRGVAVDGGFTDDGNCEPLPADAGSARCWRTYRFVGWETAPVGGRLVITNPTAQPLLPDGGVPLATPTGYELRMGNSLQTQPSTFDFVTSFQ
jgi:hypothetical protein